MTLAPVYDAVTAVQWGPSWAEMLSTAQYLGEQGYLFDIKFSGDVEKRKGANIYPELHLYDSHFRLHVITHRLWIVTYPGIRQFRVLDAKDLREQYREAS